MHPNEVQCEVCRRRYSVIWIRVSWRNDEDEDCVCGATKLLPGKGSWIPLVRPFLSARRT